MGRLWACCRRALACCFWVISAGQWVLRLPWRCSCMWVSVVFICAPCSCEYRDLTVSLLSENGAKRCVWGLCAPPGPVICHTCGSGRCILRLNGRLCSNCTNSTLVGPFDSPTRPIWSRRKCCRSAHHTASTRARQFWLHPVIDALLIVAPNLLRKAVSNLPPAAVSSTGSLNTFPFFFAAGLLKFVTRLQQHR